MPKFYVEVVKRCGLYVEADSLPDLEDAVYSGKLDSFAIPGDRGWDTQEIFQLHETAVTTTVKLVNGKFIKETNYSDDLKKKND